MINIETPKEDHYNFLKQYFELSEKSQFLLGVTNKNSPTYTFVDRTTAIDYKIKCLARTYFHDYSLHISYMLVSEEMKRQYLGQHLLRHIITFAFQNKLKSLTANTRESNIAMVNLLKKYGFDLESQNSKYKNGEKKLKFIKILYND